MAFEGLSEPQSPQPCHLECYSMNDKSQGPVTPWEEQLSSQKNPREGMLQIYAKIEHVDEPYTSLLFFIFTFRYDKRYQ